MILRAPAKLNLCLYLGPLRDDGLHELCSLFEPISLEDRLVVSEAERDEVLCPGVEGDNLAQRALAGLRQAGWESPPLRIEIEKRIPVAAGLGGGSADAAAVLRLAAGDLDPKALFALAFELGADVPSQLTPRFMMVVGAGNFTGTMPPPGEHAVVLLPDAEGLSTAEVYAEADRLRLGRSAAELEEIKARIKAVLADAVSPPPPADFTELLLNDLEPAALSLRPSIEQALAALREAGAAVAQVTGSGPTAFGLFESRQAAEVAAASIGREDAIVCEPWSGP